ncbi:hypothetical protein ACFL52_04575 [Candidatus Margulisiibacteriota bacterium]
MSGSRMRFVPFQPSNYIPFDDLNNNYHWILYKQKNGKKYLCGYLIRTDLWLPQFVDLVVDEKKDLLLKVNAYILNKEFIKAESVLIYDKNDTLAGQVTTRYLASGWKEVSVLKLKNAAAELLKEGKEL